ncbi:MAG: hypothetical protein F7C08_02180 [Desulfurococcales archaeon]|nr:hypothetical protein [Desulfurococcales archaeon]MCE4605326.1 hypothetical protein [Desulfurococcales archaeon]
MRPWQIAGLITVSRRVSVDFINPGEREGSMDSSLEAEAGGGPLRGPAGVNKSVGSPG